MIIEIISIYLIISTIVTTFFSAFIQSRGKGDYVKVLFLLSLAMDFYMFGYLQELSAASLERKLFWNFFQYLGIPFISALWLTAGLMYTGHFYSHMKTKLILIYFIPFLSFFLRLTNELHHLYFVSFQLQAYQNYDFLIKDGGIGYQIQGLHSGLMILISLYIYVSTFIKNRDFNGEKVLYMIGASVVACLGLLTTGSQRFDTMVLCLPAAMLLVLLAILRNDFLEIRMLARELVFESSKEGIILLNDQLRILDYNEAAKSILAAHGIELRKNPLDTVIGKDKPLNGLLKTSVSTVWKAGSQDNTQYYEITTTNIFRKNGIIYGKIKTFRDVTEIQLHTNYLKVQATVDELSGLLNRRAFINSCQAGLNTNISRENNCCLLMMDLDFFKQINDTYGHIAGDYVIDGFGSLLKQCFQPPDLSGRLGGEEFAVFIQQTDLNSAYEKAEQFRKSVESWQIMFKNKVLKLTVSIGIAKAHPADNIIDLIHKADSALYASKNAGRNTTSIYEKKSDH